MINSLIIADAGVQHADAHDDALFHASSADDSRMPTTVSCAAKKTKERGSVHHVYTSHALMLVCVSAGGQRWPLLCVCSADAAGATKYTL